MSKEKTNSLLNCPFCGGEARVNIFLGNYCVTCENCMGAIFPARGMTEEEAIKAWNTRKPMKRIVERLEETKTKSYVTGITANPYEFGACHAMNDAIAIVKEEGGLNEE